jgi:hypothetical protein
LSRKHISDATHVESVLTPDGPLATQRPPRYTDALMRSKAPACALALALFLSTSHALADRVVLLPARGGFDPGARTSLDLELVTALQSLGHSVVPAAETAAAMGPVLDGVADTPEEYRAVGVGTRADWVVAANVDPAVLTQRVELSAYLVSLARVESVAREVDRAQSVSQEKEMLAVLLRPEGVGAGELPWERTARPAAPVAVAVPPPPPPAVPPPQPTRIAGLPPLPSGPNRVSMDYTFDTLWVWPPYSAGKRVFVSALQGFSIAAVRLPGATGSTFSFLGGARGGYAPGDLGLELFGQVGGNFVGPRALWIDAGARWMFTPSVHPGSDGVLRGLAFHIGPELTFGAFLRLGGPDITGPNGMTYARPTTAHPAVGAALNMMLSYSPSLQLEAQIGNLRWIPTGDGSILLVGATLGAGLRF